MAHGFGYYLRLLEPKAGQKVKAGNILRIKWEKSSNFTSVDIYYRLSPKQNWVFIANENFEDKYVWNVPNNILPSQQAQIKIVGKPSPSGVEYYSVSDTFIIYKGTLIQTPYPQIIHGYGKPVIEIYDNNDNLQYELAFPRPVSLKEIWKPEIIVHKLFSGAKKYIAKGWWYEAELDFSSYSKSDLIISLQPLFDFTTKYLTENRKILFYPRGNIFEFGGNINYFYKVEIWNEMEFLMHQLQNFSGYRGVILKLIGIERLIRPFEAITYLQTEQMNKSLPYGEEKGYGTDYGENYGENL